MKRTSWKRTLCMLLVLALIGSMMPVVYGSDEGAKQVSFVETDSSLTAADLALEDKNLPASEENESRLYSSNEMVRVSVVLEGQPVLEKGYATAGIASNAGAQAYREDLLLDQQAVVARISQATGGDLDVVWNLTLAVNVISANIRYGDLETVAATDGVREVVLETQYLPCELDGEIYAPNMATSSGMTGADAAWLSGYTGAGSRIAIIDTGLDENHQSVNEKAFLYALEQNAAQREESKEEYLQSLNMLDAQEIETVLPQLNMYANSVFYESDLQVANELYHTAKVAFAYNYIDRDFDITHDNDGQGGHGSHVAGIATANRYLASQDGSFSSAREAAHVVGVAPDAQVLIMKVFGKNGGAYESDYMAAIEDAIILGCDSINLSLGSAMSGMTSNELYQETLDSLSQTDAVVVISAGNNGAWPAESGRGYLYADDVNLHTGGAPGTYANAFTVGSVENAGITGLSFQAAGQDMVYVEGVGHYGDPMVTLDISEDGSGTQWEYLFLDGVGKPEDYAKIDVTDKVVFVSRGDTSFGDKLTAAGDAGAAACVIYNNEPGVPVTMDLSLSFAMIPCVMIMQRDAQVLRAASTPVRDENGSVVGFTGEMTISHKIAAEAIESEYFTMSDFSSWGVPGDLSLKPEIIAPGGNIYSINGEVPETDQYVLNSGTSMAAPQIAGIVALMAQYLRESGLADRFGISPRILSQSLLMSTATPISQEESGLPYPVIQQGAGLANVSSAMAAGSYVLVEGQPDGKVKAELGDDPERTGVYTFQFTLNNLTDSQQVYTVRADTYTQRVFSDFATWDEVEVANYMDYTLRTLEAETDFQVDGREILPEAGQLTGCDFDGNGMINEADGQALLDYALEIRASLEHADCADLSGDGKVTAYDAELFLKRLGSRRVVLPANGSVKISVSIRLTDRAKAELDEQFANGAYVESYVYLDAMADDEGVVLPSHSIPVLAYYGGWDEPSMFDSYTYTQISNNLNDHVSYFSESYEFIPVYNYVSAVDRDGNEYYLGGNGFATEDQYLPQRNAISSTADTYISALNFSLIRNAADVRAVISNAETGEIYGEEQVGETVYAAFFAPSYGWWQYLSNFLVPTHEEGDPGWFAVDSRGNILPEGTHLVASIQAAPEYALREDGTVDWDNLDVDGTVMSIPFTIDNTAPTISAISVGTERDTATGEERLFVEAKVQDNQYTAAILLLTPKGTKVIRRAAINQTVEGAEMSARLDVTDVFGSSFQLAAVDYAGNIRCYDVSVGEPYDGPASRLIGSTTDYNNAQWGAFSNDTNYDFENILTTEQTIYASAYADGYVFYLATAPGATDSQEWLYVADYPDFSNPIQVAATPSLRNLTYNSTDGNLYTIYSDYLSEGSHVYALDVASAEMTQKAALPAGYEYDSIAYHSEENCFYTIAYIWNYDYEAGELRCPTYLMKFSLPAENQEVQLETVHEFGTLNTFGLQIALDEAQDVIYVLKSGDTEEEIYTLNLHTGEMELTGRMEVWIGSYFVPDEATADNYHIVRTQPTGLDISEPALCLFPGDVRSLQAEIRPWCLSDRTILWSSSNPEIVSVDKAGVLTAQKDGTAVITATSLLDDAVKDTCVVTVCHNDFTLSGVGTKDDGSSELFTLDLATGQLYGQVPVVDTQGNPISVEAATNDANSGEVWVRDNVVDEKGMGYRLHGVDPLTGKSDYDSDPNKNTYQDGSLLITDLAYDAENNVVLGVNGDDPVFFSDDLKTNNLGSSWFSDLGENPLKSVAVAKGETSAQTISKYTQFFLLDAENQKILDLHLSYVYIFGAWGVDVTDYTLTSALEFIADENGVYQETLVYDPITKTPILLHYTPSGTEIYAMSLDSATMSCRPCYLGRVEGYTDLSAYQITYNGALPEDCGAVAETASISDTPDALATGGEAHAAVYGTVHTVTDRPSQQNDGSVVIPIQASQAAASGMQTITLGQGLEFISLESTAMVSAYTVTGNTISFAFADEQDFTADDQIAVLRLRHDGQPTQVTLEETERGGESISEIRTVKIPRTNCNGGENCPSSTFVDLEPNAWYHEAVDYVLDAGIMVGIGNQRFKPNGSVTRGMVVTMLYRLAGEPETNHSVPFPDVPEDCWYSDAVAWAHENGIAVGVTETAFAPNAAATREQVITLFYRYVREYCQGDVSARGNLSAFSDANEISAYAMDAMSWAVAEGLLIGDGNGKLMPKQNLQRAHAAVVFYRHLIHALQFA